MRHSSNFAFNYTKFFPNIIRILGTAILAATEFCAALPTVEVEFPPTPLGGGRLYVVFGTDSSAEPRLSLGRTDRTAPPALALDRTRSLPGERIILAEQKAFSFRGAFVNTSGKQLIAQAVYATNQDLNIVLAPGNWYSKPCPVREHGTTSLTLTRSMPEDSLPPDQEQIKFVKLESALLSRFYHRSIYLRAGILLPHNFSEKSDRTFPLWVRVGGLNSRFTSITNLMREGSDFRKTWMASQTPVLLELDGAGPNGDPYQVNSANNGPYGDAITRELIPYVEARFRCVGRGQARFLSGVSTGGWAAMGLQIFYPDFFNGVWAACPDPLDFRAVEKVDIYSSTNLYTDMHGAARPSERDASGKTTLTVLEEVGAENLLGRGNFYVNSGQQWGAWNAVFGPRAPDGNPSRLWDPGTGAIDSCLAEAWKKYDLRLVLAQNWSDLYPRLKGKLHVSSGEKDKYFLNESAHLFAAALKQLQPPMENVAVFSQTNGHGWSDLSIAQLLQAMHSRLEAGETGQPNKN